MPTPSFTSYPSDRPLNAAFGAVKDIVSFVGYTMRPTPTPPHANVPRGDGHTVLVLPGFMTGVWATRTLINWLRDVGYTRVFNLDGGIDAWARDVDPSVGSY